MTHLVGTATLQIHGLPGWGGEGVGGGDDFGRACFFSGSRCSSQALRAALPMRRQAAKLNTCPLGPDHARLKTGHDHDFGFQKYGANKRFALVP